MLIGRLDNFSKSSIITFSGKLKEYTFVSFSLNKLFFIPVNAFLVFKPYFTFTNGTIVHSLSD